MSKEPDKWLRQSSEMIADCRVFKVREDFCERASDGAEHTFFVIECPNWVNVIPITKDGNVVLIEQFRQGIEEVTLEIPGGMIDSDEDIETAARRELLEETGFESNNLIYLGKSRPNPAIQNNWMHHYLALDCEETGETSFDEHESVLTRIVPIADIKQLIVDGKITHTMVIAGFYFYDLNNKYENRTS